MTLLDAIAEHGFDAAFGGARRDEERAARQGAHALASATTSASGTRGASAPSCGTSTTGACSRGEHVRVFPLSNWTELDVWQYIGAERLEVPSIYFAHEREVFERDGMLYATREHVELLDGEAPFDGLGALPHRRRHELHRRGALARRDARREVVAEIAATRITERGETRADDRVSEAAMEDRKREGYF